MIFITGNALRERVRWLMVIGFILTIDCVAIAAEDKPSGVVAPPTWIKPPFDRGLVTIEFYDPAKQKKPFPGWTDFEFELAYNFDYEYSTKDASANSLPSKVAPKTKKPVSSKDALKKKQLVIVEPTFTKISFIVRHRVQLPLRLDTPRVWEDSLSQHELEHVAIGAHRRLELLTDHLLKKIKRIEKTVEPNTEIDLEWVNKAIAAEVDPRRKSLDELIKGNNKRLDKLTAHGAQPHQDRDAFFGRLYLKENLDELKFPYLADVIQLLNSEDYIAAKWESDSDLKRE